MASKYAGMGTGWLKAKVLPPALRFLPPSPSVSRRALISAVAHSGTDTTASYVNLAPGVSWHGTSARACIAWHCVKKYGCALPAVSSGVSHWQALEPALVE